MLKAVHWVRPTMTLPVMFATWLVTVEAVSGGVSFVAVSTKTP